MIDNIKLDKKFKNVGVKLSGGADSSILYYAVCKYYADTDTKVFPITLATSGKPYYIDYAKRIIEKVEELTGKSAEKHYTIFKEHEGFSNEQVYIEGQNEIVKKAIEEQNLEIVYSGLTKNPKYSIFSKFLRENQESMGYDYETIMFHLNKRDKSRDPEAWYQLVFPTIKLWFEYRVHKTKNFIYDWNAEHNYVLFKLGLKPRKPHKKKYTPFDPLLHFNGVYFNRPFATGDKRGVFKAYDDLNMMDILYPLTFSCEDTTEYNGIGPDHKHCEHCFFCAERWYGFNRII